MSKIRLYFLHFLKKNKNNYIQKKRNYSYYNDIFLIIAIITIEDWIGLKRLELCVFLRSRLDCFLA